MRRQTDRQALAVLQTQSEDNPLVVGQIPCCLNVSSVLEMDSAGLSFGAGSLPGKPYVYVSLVHRPE